MSIEIPFALLSPHLSIGWHSHGGRHHLVTLATATVQWLWNAFDGWRYFESSCAQLRWLLRLLRLLWLLRLLRLQRLLLDHDHVFGMVIDEPSDGLPVGRWIARTAIGRSRRRWQLVLGWARTYHWRSRVSPCRNRRHRGRWSGRVQRLKKKYDVYKDAFRQS